DGEAEHDTTKASQGTGSVKATVINEAGGYDYPGVELRIASGDPLNDWRAYESFIYDVWPEVNASALDQAPDLYSFKLYNTNGCDNSNITQGGPPLALDQWNYASVSLNPFHTCTTPNFDNITRMEFHTRDNETVNGNSGLWDDGDELILWFDNVRLVDQDNGTLKWEAGGSTTTYYVYFDTLDHEGHPLPTLAELGASTITGTPETAEAGGYYHQVTGANTGGLSIWAAPAIEKILKTDAVPVAEAPLRIYAAKDEFEPFQLVVNAPADQQLAVNITDFKKGGDIITATNVTLHRVDYVTLTRLSDDFGRLGEWPDPLYPVAMGGNVTFPAKANQPLWFTVHVPRDAQPGSYQATVSIGSATIPVELEVWDFALPEEIHLAGEWGFGWSQMVETYKGTSGGSVQSCYWDLVDSLYEDFAGHRLTPKGVGWPAGLNYPGGVEYDCNGNLDPDAWNDWDFHTIAEKYLQGTELDNHSGFPNFLIKGPSQNAATESRPSSFCSVSRGTEPPGNTDYNTKWFQYWDAIGDYLSENPDYEQKGYYHIVNEPQTFADYDIVAYLAQETKKAASNVRILVSEQVEPGIYANSTYPDAKIDIWMPTISNYQVEKAHDRQVNHNEEVWWYFLYGDRPPLPNPTVIDRTGIEARITPWLAWMERVEGLVYYSITAANWEDSPWDEPWLRDANGDGFMLYPPKDGTIAFDACDTQSNRLVPSIRWELLREGMEDYEYLWVLNEGEPQIGETNEADTLAQQFINSRTSFSRVPTDLYAARAAIAQAISGPVTTTPPSTVTLSGPTTGYANTFYTFTATINPTATTPLTVTWSIPELNESWTHTPEGLMDTFSTLWKGQSGFFTVTVTAENSAGEASANQIIHIKYGECITVSPTLSGTLIYSDTAGGYPGPATIYVPVGAARTESEICYIPLNNYHEPWSDTIYLIGPHFALYVIENNDTYTHYTPIAPITLTMAYEDEKLVSTDESKLRIYFASMDTINIMGPDAANACYLRDHGGTITGTPEQLEAYYTREPEQNRLSVQLCELYKFALVSVSDMKYAAYLPVIMKQGVTRSK
ncbi:MAG: DUF4091 domain-containing protein, partial [Anaerolineae bacterium]|nr:DUF4091 domain-containing protein [Anaerolineae bacterium]